MTDRLTEALTLFDNPSGLTWEADRQLGQSLGVIADALEVVALGLDNP